MTTTTTTTATVSQRLTRACSALGLAASLVGLLATAGSAAAPPSEGTQYVRIGQQVPAPAREVVEVAWYDCAHSYLLAQPLRAWAARQKPAVTIRFVPAAWSDQPEQMAYARVYYTLDRLGVAVRLEQAMFHAVHDQHRDLTTLPALQQWAKTQPGVDQQRLADAWNSPQVQQETQDAPALRERYDVHEMPSVVVGGEYRTSPFLAPGGVDGVVPVVDYLLQHVAEERAQAGTRVQAH